MPNMRSGYRQLSVLVPDETYLAVQALAEQLGRSMAAEVEHALRRHVAAPPRAVAVETPELADVPAPPARRPGRKKAPKAE